MSKVSLAIVCSRFNEEITSAMLKEAEAHAEKKGAEVAAVLEVPGAYEIPFAMNKLLPRPDIDAGVALGTVIKGETLHDEVIMMAVCKQLSDLSIRHGKPVGLGISGPGITEEQAKARIKDYARRSVEAAIEMAKLE
ncbi:6,7-dimethyl-8-ribityllumazine synthase [uncultured archaeon]|nr:6,7-dimethyl-8-ribityllumazine synthase [uncultured archaeon]